jgi:hypothetical protein
MVLPIFTVTAVISVFKGNIMNIFAVSADYVVCANYLDDKRANKMYVETVQILSTALNYYSPGIAPYKSTHINHPSNVWARTTRANWLWLLNHAIALKERNLRRSGKHHKTTDALNQILTLSNIIPDGELTPFSNNARNPEYDLDFTHLEVHLAYKTYLHARWKLDKLTPIWNGQLPELKGIEKFI